MTRTLSARQMAG